MQPLAHCSIDSIIEPQLSSNDKLFVFLFVEKYEIFREVFIINFYFLLYV